MNYPDKDDSALHEEMLELLPVLRASARALTRCPFESDDLVQETLTKAIAKSNQFTPGTNLRAWLCTIQRNTFYTNYHRRTREPVLVVDELPGYHSAASQDWFLKLKDVDRAMDKLHQDQREAVVLVGGAGFSYEEAAEICDCALGTIKSRVSRARTALLQHLESEDQAAFLAEDDGLWMADGSTHQHLPT